MDTIEKSVDKRHKDDVGLISAIEKGDISKVKSYFRGARFPGVIASKSVYCDISPLSCAAKHGHTEIAKFLVEKGADVKGQGYDFPLHFAAENGHVVTVEYLIMAGANVNASNIKGMSAIHYAAGNGHTKVVVSLINAGADVNIRRNGNYTALHYAASCGCTEMVRALINAGADVNAEITGGNTALICAARGKHFEAAEILLEETKEKQKTNSAKGIIKSNEIVKETAGKEIFKGTQVEQKTTEQGKNENKEKKPSKNSDNLTIGK